MNTVYSIAVTLAEFQAWYNAGEFRCAPDRMVAVSLDADGRPRLYSVESCELLARFPFVDLEEEHNVLLTVVDVTGLPDDHTIGLAMNGGLALRNVHVPISCLSSIHPLTQRAARILSARLEGCGIRLREPLDEAGAEALWRSCLWRRSCRGGNELLRALVANHTYVPSPEIVEEVRHAVEGFGEKHGINPTSLGLLSTALGYDRHKAISPADVGYVFDLGVILKDRFGDEPAYAPLIAGLRAFCRTKEPSTEKLSQLLIDTQFVSLLMTQDVQRRNLLVSLVVYLRWRYIAQKTGTIEIGRLSDDVRDYAGKITKCAIEQAIWLLGAYAGFDRLAKEIYTHDTRRYRFMANSAPHEPYVVEDPLPPPSEATPEPEPSPPSDRAGASSDVAPATSPELSAAPEPATSSPTEPEPGIETASGSTSAAKPKSKQSKSKTKSKVKSPKTGGDDAFSGELKFS